TLSFTASGNIGAADVWISDTIPPELTDVSFSSSLVVNEDGVRPAYRWDVGDLAPGASGVITISALIDPDLAADATIINRAELGGLHGTEPIGAEDTAAIDVRLPRVSLSVTN